MLEWCWACVVDGGPMSYQYWMVYLLGPPLSASRRANRWNNHIHVPVCEYCFTSLSAQSWPFRYRMKPEAGTIPYSYFQWFQGFFIVHNTIGSTVHCRPLNSLEHCICTTVTTNIRPLPGFEPGTSRLQAAVDTNEPSGPANYTYAGNHVVCNTWNHDNIKI